MKVSLPTLGLSGLAVAAAAVVGAVSFGGHSSPNAGGVPVATASATATATVTPSAAASAQGIVGVNTSKPVVAWIGDGSITGLNAGGMAHGVAALTTAALSMDWQVAAQAETGFATAGIPGVQGLNSAYPARVASVVAMQPKLVVIASGTNDAVRGASAADVRAGVRKTVTELRAGLPGVPVVIVGPTWSTTAVPAVVTQTAATIEAEAKSLGVPYVDPVAEQWLTTANQKSYVAQGFLTPDGNLAYAADLTRDLTALHVTG